MIPWNAPAVKGGCPAGASDRIRHRRFPCSSKIRPLKDLEPHVLIKVPGPGARSARSRPPGIRPPYRWIPMLQELPSQPLPPLFRRQEQHFQLSVLNSHKGGRAQPSIPLRYHQMRHSHQSLGDIPLDLRRSRSPERRTDALARTDASHTSTTSCSNQPGRLSPLLPEIFIATFPSVKISQSASSGLLQQRP